MLPTPVTKDELLINARTYCMDYVKLVAVECVKRGFPLNSASASMMARIALQCYCEGALAITAQLEEHGRSIKQVLELKDDEIDAFVRAFGGISPEKAIELNEQDKRQMSKG